MKRILLALSGLVLICAALAIFIVPAHRDAAWYASFVQKHERRLIEIAEGERDPEDSLGDQWMLMRGGVEQMHAYEECARFFLKGGNLEGSYAMVYFPDGEYVLRDENNGWTFVETSDGSLRWEGAGMGGRGYCHVHRLSENFFLEDIYLPT